MKTIPLNYFLSFFLLFISNKVDVKTHTHQTKEAIEKIDQLNQPSFRFPKKECQNCLKFSGLEVKPKPEKEEDLLQQCAVDLCGPANESSRHIFDNSTFATADTDPEIINNFNKTVLPIIKEAIQTKLNSDERILNVVGKGLKNPDNISHEDWKHVAYIAYDTISPMKDLRHAHSTGNLPYIRKKYEEFMRKYENNKTKFTEEKREEIIQLGQRLKNGDIDRRFIVTLNNLIRKSKIVNCSEEPNCKQWMYSELSKLHQKYERTIQDWKNDTRQHIKYCQSVYISELKSPQTFIENFENYKNRFLNKVFSNYSQLSKQFFGNYINKTLQFKLPSPQTNNITQQNFIDEVIGAQSLFQRRLKSMDNLLSALYGMIDKRTLSICPGFLRQQFRQTSFSYRHNKISLSLFSCTFHEHGKQGLAHELAHAMSYLFASNKLSEKSYGKYKELRKCASKRYKKGAPYTLSKPSKKHPFYHNNDRFKTEEDTADLIAYKVFQEDSGPLFCAGLTLSKNGEKYEPLALFQPSYKHSAALLRTIIHAIHKRIKLPESCQQVVDMYKDRVNFEPCF